MCSFPSPSPVRPPPGEYRAGANPRPKPAGAWWQLNAGSFAAELLGFPDFFPGGGPRSLGVVPYLSRLPSPSVA